MMRLFKGLSPLGGGTRLVSIRPEFNPENFPSSAQLHFQGENHTISIQVMGMDPRCFRCGMRGHVKGGCIATCLRCGSTMHETQHHRDHLHGRTGYASMVRIGVGFSPFAQRQSQRDSGPVFSNAAAATPSYSTVAATPSDSTVGANPTHSDVDGTTKTTGNQVNPTVTTPPHSDAQADGSTRATGNNDDPTVTTPSVQTADTSDNQNVATSPTVTSASPTGPEDNKTDKSSVKTRSAKDKAVMGPPSTPPSRVATRPEPVVGHRSRSSLRAFSEKRGVSQSPSKAKKMLNRRSGSNSDKSGEEDT